MSSLPTPTPTQTHTLSCTRLYWWGWFRCPGNLRRDLRHSYGFPRVHELCINSCKFLLLHSTHFLSWLVVTTTTLLLLLYTDTESHHMPTPHTRPHITHTHTYSLLAVFDGLSLLLDPEIIEIVSVSVELYAIFPIISIWSELRESWRLITRAAHTTHLSHTPHKLACIRTCTLV